ncbi:aldehyde dehydrogenase family protein [Parageobacillus thermoglucosidasius]|uniref:Aldehyde dehydrogenase family protein n=1 Tax=Parageobacillus thermoglucosidasius TaxID=1426 RepID=A0AB38R377_PARTM|nr:aldehyde dehydrogenase family protein [Parageobacillus thermoglucosidasius]AEH48855.1 Benzaldehyde dehydrogenase (NAD(+)) [Parageobacillus thermoglucosidasius C56-YS93]UOE77187.1 aldehyde dehydrogenase family protein [Parageobacillus thermoglucosidasius]
MKQFLELNKSFINGEWVEGASANSYDILNPYDDSVITTVKLATKEQTQKAFEAAYQAQKKWAKTPVEERKAIIRKALEYFKENKEAILEALAVETGSTYVKAEIEYQSTLAELAEAEKMTEEIYAYREVPSPIEGKTNRIYRLPLGVISSISPFNFPLFLSIRTIAPAIALGNAVVHKPDLKTGLTGGSIIAAAFEYAGLPKGVFNVVLTSSREIGDEMLTNPHSKMVSFTGSTEVGKRVGAVAGGSLKRVALELGGNSPFVVLSDADVDRAVEAAIFGKYLHQGQICMIVNRFIIHQDVYDEFVNKFVERAKKLPYGDPRNRENVIGPIIDQRQLEKALKIIEEAKAEGIPLALEGKRVGNILTPTVFVNVDNNSKLAQTEVFAPIAIMIKAETDEQAIELANGTEYGLSSAIFTSDLEKGTKLALEIDSGMTHVNDQTVNLQSDTPFGGTKASGLGRFGNPWIVEEFTETKWVSVQHQYRKFPF